MTNCFVVLVVKEGHTITHSLDTIASGRLRAPSTTVHWIYNDILTATLFIVECGEPLCGVLPGQIQYQDYDEIANVSS
nr:MAG TPA: hypothetical protein [Caudoviricetes sp.]